MHGLGDKPFWLDEWTTLRRAALPFGSMVQDSLTYHHLPAYFALESLAVGFGDQESLARLPSAILGALTCGLIASATARIGGRPAGLLAGLLLAFTPIQVQYGQEARSYTMIMACIAIALTGLLRLAEHPSRAAIPMIRRDADRLGWGLLLGGTWAAVNTLSIAVAWPVAATLGWAWVTATAADRRGLWRNWLLGHAAIAAATLPWFIAMIRLTHGYMTDGLTWIPPLDWPRAWSAIAQIYLMRVGSLTGISLFPGVLPGLAVLIGVVVPLLTLGGCAWLARHRPASLRILLPAALLLPLCLALVSVVFPLWMPRYLLWGTLPFAALAGCGINLLPRAGRLPGAVILGAIAVVNLAGYYPAETKPRWDLAAHALHTMAGPDDLILVDDERMPDVMGIYLRREGADFGPQRWTMDAAAARDRLRDGVPVWNARGVVGQIEPPNPDMLPPTLRGLGRQITKLRFGRDVVLFRLDP